MADHLKVHPVHDVEAPQTSPKSPLVPPGTSKSDKVEEVQHQHPAPFQPTIPVTQSKPPKKKRSCLCRCLCWTVCLLVLLIIIIGIIVGIIFLVFRPKLPKYSVDTIQITQFNLSSDDSLYATFDVTITARNPNKKIGIYYEGGSNIGVWYTDRKLCQGALPKFYQGHRNTTVLNVDMTGQTQNATGLLTTLQQQLQETGGVPLTLRVNQPVRIKLGKLKLFKIKFRVRCRLVVDSLSPNNGISTRSTSCKFRLRL
ncbi:hypothetical protein F2P56_000158 [Juglans regia]|uniref:NDR1/HIN1-like protein 6 n=2 Tax=Juglans regia TaxID=51240 RepID=A0A2I4FR82_JUGRE|nr:NDR1/HIN1-like protein 6 [Juglans regia]KAF5479325.1 hypothetical protein F2P56_000158 [Juglans regia]